MKEEIAMSHSSPPNALTLPPGFALKDDGLWFRGPYKNRPPIKICGPFTIEASTCDDNGFDHGLWLKWTGRYGRQYTWVMPLRLLHARGSPIATPLHGAGLYCGSTRRAHELLKIFLNEVTVERHIYRSTTCGPEIARAEHEHEHEHGRKQSAQLSGE
jgi:hypothetical protein